MRFPTKGRHLDYVLNITVATRTPKRSQQEKDGDNNNDDNNKATQRQQQKQQQQNSKEIELLGLPPAKKKRHSMQ